MRKITKELVNEITKHCNCLEPIYEFGSLQVEGQEEYADLRKFFQGKNYVGCDMREGIGVDKVLDLHSIDLPENTIGTAVLIDTLEHVEYVRKAVDEVHRVLKPDGFVIATSVMNFPIHSFPFDYWRFTPKAFESIFQKYDWLRVEAIGMTEFPHTVVAIAAKTKPDQAFIQMLDDAVNIWKRKWNKPWLYNFKYFVINIMPPVIINGYFNFKRLMQK
jgi:SAM-dependent methyltransferase